eukprot:1383256-Prymnesium_polylepis.1
MIRKRITVSQFSFHGARGKKTLVWACSHSSTGIKRKPDRRPLAEDPLGTPFTRAMRPLAFAADSAWSTSCRDNGTRGPLSHSRLRWAVALASVIAGLRHESTLQKGAPHLLVEPSSGLPAERSVDVAGSTPQRKAIPAIGTSEAKQRSTRLRAAGGRRMSRKTKERPCRTAVLTRLREAQLRRLD